MPSGDQETPESFLRQFSCNITTVFTASLFSDIPVAVISIFRHFWRNRNEISHRLRKTGVILSQGAKYLAVFSIFDCAVKGLIRAVFNEISSVCLFPTTLDTIYEIKMRLGGN